MVIKLSIDALRWAWVADVKTSSERLVLLAFADRAGEDNTAWPSMARLEKDTKLDIKTVKKVVNTLIENGFLVDTGERKGSTGRVRVLQLVGVNCREFNNEPKNGMIPNLPCNEPKFGSLNEPNIGTQNLSKKQPKKQPVVYSEKFEKFWNEYPKCKRKGTKEAANKTFTKYQKDFEMIMKVLEEFKKDEMWTKNNGEFIAAPGSWLNKQYWKTDYWIEQVSNNSADKVQAQENVVRRAVAVPINYLD